MPYTENGFVPFLLLPDWSKGVLESLAWSTRIIGPTLTGMRQKRMMRIAPRRSIEFDIAATQDSRRWADNLLFGQGKREWMLPIWHDRQTTSASLPAGSGFIPCDTAGYDFSQYAILCKNEFNPFDFEIFEIDSVEVGGLQLVSALDFDWPQYSVLYPLRRAVLASFPSMTLPTNTTSSGRVRFDITEPCDWPAHEFADTYLGWPVWDRDNDWREVRNLAFNRIINTVDNETSIPVNFDFPDNSFVSLNSAATAAGRAEASELRSLLYALQGRFKSIWLPSMLDDLTLVSPVSSSATNITVRKCGYTLFGKQRRGRRDIRVELLDGTVFYRRITSSSEGASNETLTLNSSFGQSVSPSQVRKISFMSLAQQASDSIDLSHPTDADGATTCSFVFEGVIEPPAA